MTGMNSAERYRGFFKELLGRLFGEEESCQISPEESGRDNRLDEVSSTRMRNSSTGNISGDTDMPLFIKKGALHHHGGFHTGDGHPMSMEGTNITILARVLRIRDASCGWWTLCYGRGYSNVSPGFHRTTVTYGARTFTSFSSRVMSSN